MPNQLEPWHDFYVMTGGAAAALTGLLFVAMSIHLREIAEDTTRRLRARVTLQGLVVALVVSGLALLPGQGVRFFGLELTLLAIVTVVLGLVQAGAMLRAAGHRGSRPMPGYRVRMIVNQTLGLLAVAVGALLISGEDGALYALAGLHLLLISYMVYNSWGLLLVVSAGEGRRHQT
jgi:modulator of FtsH protease